MFQSPLRGEAAATLIYKFAFNAPRRILLNRISSRLALDEEQAFEVDGSVNTYDLDRSRSILRQVIEPKAILFKINLFGQFRT